MSVRLEFLNLIIRRDAIDRRYTGGWAQCLLDHAGLIGGPVLYFDDHLLRDGAMSSSDMRRSVAYWEERGLRFLRNVAGRQVAADMCVVDHFGGPTTPCDWLVFDFDQRTAAFALEASGDSTGRS